MRVVVIGGNGFLGRKLAAALLERGALRGRPITALDLLDIVEPAPLPAAMPLRCLAADIADPAQLRPAFADRPDVVFHLAAVVSGQAEAEFDTGMRINLTGTLNVLEAARAAGNRPVLVYSSSLAVYGGDLPEPVTDHALLNPQNSYGTQKAIGELLLNDYSRKGFVDGRGLRLPTVTIRPGRPNKAASSFMSSIFREPLQGEDAVCPVPPESEVFVSAPRNAVANLVQGAELDGALLGGDRCLMLPGITVSVGDMVEALRRVAGDEPVARIRWQRDPAIERIVLGWKARFEPARALRLGFAADRDFEDNVRWFVEDDLRR